ncbi:uncharacterized protein TNCV_2330861 [Trichonephila clavipes]|nr:uncharacterized protein TNCV_2330861 [Trichonephila clavipes]
MNICRCIVPSRPGGTLNSRGSTCPLVRLVKGEEREVPQGVLPQNRGETQLNSSVTCVVLKAMANDRHHLACQKLLLIGIYLSGKKLV